MTAIAAPSTVTFQKVKWNGTEVKLVWSTSSLVAEVEHSLRSFQAPHQDFVDAFRAFIPLVLELLELSDEYASDFKVIGFSINTEEDGRLGLVVTCAKQLADANAPLILNTPHLRERNDEETTVGFLPDRWLDALSDVQSAAEAFLEGRRAQGDLFAGAGR